MLLAGPGHINVCWRKCDSRGAYTAYGRWLCGIYSFMNSYPLSIAITCIYVCMYVYMYVCIYVCVGVYLMLLMQVGYQAFDARHVVPQARKRVYIFGK